jgi:hypothetical protein
MKNRFNWKEIQEYYDAGHSIEEVSKRYNIKSYCSFWKAKARGDFVPRDTSSAMKLSVKQGKSNPAERGRFYKNKIANTVNQKIENGDWHVSLAKNMWKVYNGQKFHGTWEVKYAKWLDKNKIQWRKPSETFKYEFQGKTKRYTPDFYLIEDACYVEIKGYETDKDRAKWSQFPLKHKVIKKQDFKNMGIF